MLKTIITILLSLVLLSCSTNNTATKKKTTLNNKTTNSESTNQNFSRKAIVIYVNANGFIIDDNFKKVIKLGFEEIATEKNYVIIDDLIKQEAFERIKKAHNWSQNDPKFLVELGKQISATNMVYIDITKLSEENYNLSNRWISLKNGTIENTKTFSFNYRFNNNSKEILFGEIQKLASYFLTKQIENRIVISIDSKLNIDENLKKIIRLAFEEIATDNNYSIVDDNIKKKAYQRILKEHNWSQNDPKFLVELNKQLSSKEMVIIEITRQGNNYLFTNRLVNLESGLSTKTVNKTYSPENDKDYLNLFKTVKKLAKKLLCKNCVNQKSVYLELHGNILSSNEYQHTMNNATESLTKKGYLIASDKKSSDLIFSITISDNNNKKQLTLKQINKDNKVFKTIIKTCRKPVSDCVKLLFINRFQQRKIMNKWGVEFAEVPKGEFSMGYDGPNALEVEKNNFKTVKITNNFFISKTEVTQKFYETITGKNPSANKCDFCPVDSVSFSDVSRFIEKLNKTDNKFNYRLPSEAEWEYAARSGKKTPFFWGNTDASLDQFAWYGGNSSGKTHKVATKKPNPWGLFDVTGNLFEMTSSFEKIKYFDKKTFKYAIKNVRIAKGGCYTSKDSNHLRSTVHIRIKSETAKSSRLGFRLIIEKK